MSFSLLPVSILPVDLVSSALVAFPSSGFAKTGFGFSLRGRIRRLSQFGDPQLLVISPLRPLFALVPEFVGGFAEHDYELSDDILMLTWRWTMSSAGIEFSASGGSDRVDADATRVTPLNGGDKFVGTLKLWARIAGNFVVVWCHCVGLRRFEWDDH